METNPLRNAQPRGNTCTRRHRTLPAILAATLLSVSLAAPGLVLVRQGNRVLVTIEPDLLASPVHVALETLLATSSDPVEQAFLRLLGKELEGVGEEAAATPRIAWRTRPRDAPPSPCAMATSLGGEGRWDLPWFSAWCGQDETVYALLPGEGVTLSLFGFDGRDFRLQASASGLTVADLDAAVTCPFVQAARQVGRRGLAWAAYRLYTRCDGP